MSWTIYYGDGVVVHGQSNIDWQQAPNTGVQVVVCWRIPPWTNRPWAGVIDRELWTGDDTYDPWGWGVKFGTWLPDEDYTAIWKRAAYGDHDIII